MKFALESKVSTPDGEGVVRDYNMRYNMYTVRLLSGSIRQYTEDQLQ